MAKSFDASTKFLVELNPVDWLRLLGLPIGPTRIAEADFSTVSSAADRLVVVDTPSTPYGLLVEFQGNTDATFEDRLLEYGVLAKRRLHLPVLAVAVLLRPFAGHGLLRGRSIMRGPDGELLLDFRYRVLRV